jgi:hypothetical protein
LKSWLPYHAQRKGFTFRVRVSPKEPSHLFNSPTQSLMRRRKLFKELSSPPFTKKGLGLGLGSAPESYLISLTHPLRVLSGESYLKSWLLHHSQKTLGLGLEWAFAPLQSATKSGSSMLDIGDDVQAM